MVRLPINPVNLRPAYPVAGRSNFIVTYDLNGPRPSHAEMDRHLAALGPSSLRGRVLETVWYVAYPGNAVQLRDYIRRILGPEDLLLVVEATNAAWTKLLVDDVSFQTAFNQSVMTRAA